MLHIPRVYVDTSVVGGVFDPEFSLYSNLFFDQVREGKFIVLLSNVLTAELEGAPADVLKFYKSLQPSFSEYIEESEASAELASEYIKAGVVGATSFTDCHHIAIATYANADILVSWNFKHIVNINRIRGYNSVNLQWGFKALEIRNPREIIEP